MTKPIISFNVALLLFALGFHAEAGHLLLPLICAESTKSGVSAFVEEAQAKAPSGLNAKLKKLEYRSFDHGGEYAKYIHDRFFSGENRNTRIVSFYKNLGLKEEGQMIQDIVEDVWVSGDDARCVTIKRWAEGGGIEDLTNRSKPVPVK